MQLRSTRRFAIYLIGGLLGAAALPSAADSPATAADPQPAAVTAEPAAAEPAVPAQKPKVVCKTEKVTGSSIKKKTCRTQEQAVQDHRQSQEYLDKVQGSAGVNGGGQGGL